MSVTLTGRIRLLIAAVCIAAAIIARIPCSRDHGDVPDIDSYLAMAQGDYGSAYAPFSARIVAPFLAFCTSHLCHIGVEPAFAIVSAISVAIFVFVAVRLMRIENPLLLWFVPLAVLVSPWLTEMAKTFDMPEMVHAAIAVCLFWALSKRSWVWAPLLVALYLARESTILLALTMVAVFLLRRERISAAVAIVACAIAMVIQHKASSLARPNVHSIGAAPYLISKVIHHGALNLTGLHFLADSSHFYGNFHKIWTISAPLKFMGITQVGFLGFEPYFPALLVLSAVTLFGIIPLACFFGAIHLRRNLLAEAPIEVVVAAAYSLLSWIAAPFLGDALARYISEAWPLAVVAFPWIIRQMGWSAGLQMRLAIAQVCACWSPFFCSRLLGHGIGTMLAASACGIAAQFAAWQVLRSREREVVHVPVEIGLPAEVVRD